MAGGCPLTAVRRTRSFCIGRATEGRSFYVQIKDQFRPTWRSYAGPPQQRRISVPVDGDPLGSKYRYSRKQGGSEGAGRRRAFGPGRPVRPGNGFAFRAGSEGSYVVSLPLGRWVPVGANIMPPIGGSLVFHGRSLVVWFSFHEVELQTHRPTGRYHTPRARRARQT